MASLSTSDQLYIYTIRRARIKGNTKYVGLIPKLFGYIYEKEGIGEFVDLPEFITNIKKGMSNRDLFIELLNDKSNYLFNTEYISIEDKQKIIEMNLKLFDENMDDKLFDSFIEHLFYGHEDMKYGLYFTLKYAKDDTDFRDSFNKLNKTNKNDRIIQYMKFDKFLEHIKELNRIYHFNSNILYANSGWHFGKITTIEDLGHKRVDFEVGGKYECSQLDVSVVIDTPCTDEHIDLFNKKIKNKYPNNTDELTYVELICELPLDYIFNFFYVKTSRNKYLKYKKKYLTLIKQIENINI
jgi:disulfide oxidoreductase YuzD